MVSEQEKQSYFEARNRALERIVKSREFRAEADRAFIGGLLLVHPNDPTLGGITTDEEITAFMHGIKCESNFAFSAVLGICAHIEAVKGKGYQASWQKRGIKDGAWVNLQRKWDRLEALFERGLSTEDGGETMITTLADLAVYAIKTIALRTEMNPAEFRAWIKEVQSM